MGDVVRAGDGLLEQYKKLLLWRDNLKKEAFQIEAEYTRVFGELIIALFRKKMECLRLRRTIEFCQISVNRGDAIDVEELQETIREEMSELKEHLDNLVRQVQAVNDKTCLTDESLKAVKGIYHELAKTLHPDMNPKVADQPELLDMWQRIVVAYECNDLEELQELAVLVKGLLNDTKSLGGALAITDVEGRIHKLQEEIRKITTTEPYIFREILEDPERISGKTRELKENIRAFDDYRYQLEFVLEKLLGRGVVIKWELEL